MITLKNKELEFILLTILKQDKDGNIVGGLLSETMALSTKRKLEKIFKTVLENYREFSKARQEILQIKDNEQKEKELLILLDEEVKLQIDKIQISLIEEITTANVYDFSIIEKFTE